MADIALTEMIDFGLASVLSRAEVKEKEPSPLPFRGGAGGGGSPLGRSPEAEGLEEFWAVAPGQWLAFAATAAPDWAETLGERLAGVADVIDQSSAYVLWQVTGGDAQRLLQKGLPVDLAALAPGATVVSAIAHIGAIVHCRAPDSYYIAVFRSFALSFRNWLDASVAALPFRQGPFA